MTFSKLRFSDFKEFVSRSILGELQLTHISLNFKTSYCNSGVWKQSGFSILLILNKINLLFLHMLLEAKMENPTHSFRGMDLVLQLI